MAGRNPKSDDDESEIVFNDMPKRNAKEERGIPWKILLIFLVGFFISWMIFAPSQSEKAQQELAEQQMPGNSHPPGSVSSNIYDFIYKLFGGQEFGLNYSPENIRTTKHLEPFNIDVQDLFEGAQPGGAVSIVTRRPKTVADVESMTHYFFVREVIGRPVYDRENKKTGILYDILVGKDNAEPFAVILDERNQTYLRDLKDIRFKKVMKLQGEKKVPVILIQDTKSGRQAFDYAKTATADKFIMLKNQKDGRVLDHAGNLVGKAEPIIYQRAQLQKLFITMRAMPKFRLLFENAQVLENPVNLDIQLTQKQTSSLAKAILEKNPAR